MRSIGSRRTRAPAHQGTSSQWMEDYRKHSSGRVLMMIKRILLALAIATMTLTAADNRIFELRTYHCYEGKLPDLTKRFREHTTQLFEKHGMTNIGYWIPTDGPASKNT